MSAWNALRNPAVLGQKQGGFPACTASCASNGGGTTHAHAGNAHFSLPSVGHFAVTREARPEKVLDRPKNRPAAADGVTGGVAGGLLSHDYPSLSIPV
jgi:hypothetical protein